MKRGVEERKILAVVGEVYFISVGADFSRAISNVYTDQDLVDDNFSLSQPAQWVPEMGDTYFFLNSDGMSEVSSWRNRDFDKFALSIGNVHPSTVVVESYKLRLQELAKGGKI